MENRIIIGVLMIFGSLTVIILGFYFYQWYSTHSSKNIKSLEIRCKRLEQQVIRLEKETKLRDEKIASLLNQNQRLELSISGNYIELIRSYNRQDEEIRKLEKTIDTLRKINHEQKFERDWESHFENRSC